MTPFLQQVARHYLEVPSLEDYCFIFPNRRGGQFFLHYLQELLICADKQQGITRPHIMPCVTSINDFVTELTGKASASNIEMMFALYEAYCQEMKDHAQEFDRFIYWAQLIISDFNDIDRSLADAGEIYQNLEDLHDVTSNYLSTEVKEKVKSIFGENLFTAFFDTRADANLWRLSDKSSSDDDKTADSKVKQEFLSLWNVLKPIYDGYHEVLKRRGVLSPGRQLRVAAECPPEETRYSHLVFVGFGVLSAAEIKLFDHFNKLGQADFWWDNAGIRQQLEIAPHDPGALLIDGYCQRFKAQPLEPLGETLPSIRVVAVPSTVGQAKQAFDEVALMSGENRQPGIDTAIVLPDESLLVPLLHSVHGVNRLNVTLGYPLRSSGIVSLMHIVARMHHQASKEHGVWTYYREDVNDILSHPLIKNYFTSEALAMTFELASTNRFRVPANEFEKLSFYGLFKPAVDSEQSADNQPTDYLSNLLSFCELLMQQMQQQVDAVNTDDNEENDMELPLQQAFLVMYMDVLNQLKASLEEYGQTFERSISTLFYVIDRLTASAVVPFTGMPLEGLQIMGLLETRGLDFENIVILSMNERIFPRHRSVNSFIPNFIRRAYGMSTIEQQEAIVSFNFYRLLNRSRHVTFIYDSSAQKLGSAEPSRYIAQLEKVYNIDMEHVEMTVEPHTSNPIAIQVPNEGGHLRELYTKPDGKFLSASAINKYINCPLMFYLHYVQRLSDDNELSDFMDRGTFGNIIHDTLSECYQPREGEKVPHTFTSDEIDFFVKRRLDQVIERNIKRHYLHVPEDQLATDTRPLKGDALMLVDSIRSYIKFVLDYDKDLAPFTVLECEVTHEMPGLRIGNEVFNFTYKPDRVDRLADGTVRIVDYKTGGDTTCFVDAEGLPELFDGTMAKRRKAVLQLFLYCYAYLIEHPELQQVTPVIYKVAAMQESGVLVGGPKAKSKPQYVFSREDSTAQDFARGISDVIKSLFDDDFTQTPEGAKSGCCNYCRFIDICRRTPKVRFNI